MKMWNHRICMRSEPTLQHHSHDSPSCGDVYFLSSNKAIDTDLCARSRAPSQYPKRRLFVRSRKISKPRDLYLELSDRSEIWQALRQQCCRCACQISKRYDNLKYQSRGFETLRDLTKRRLSRYWDGALVSRAGTSIYIPQCMRGVITCPCHYAKNSMKRNHFENAISKISEQWDKTMAGWCFRGGIVLGSPCLLACYWLLVIDWVIDWGINFLLRVCTMELLKTIAACNCQKQYSSVILGAVFSGNMLIKTSIQNFWTRSFDAVNNTSAVYIL